MTLISRAFMAVALAALIVRCGGTPNGDNVHNRSWLSDPSYRAVQVKEVDGLKGRFKSNYESLVTINRIIVIQINASLVSGKAS